jgi:hypothetical protein
MASCALFGFFLLFKFLDPYWINKIISTYCEFDSMLRDWKLKQRIVAGASVFAIQLVSTRQPFRAVADNI